MYPELFELPFVHLTVKSYGLMMVIGFISAVFIIRRLSRDITPNPQYITNAALYSLIAGVTGARLFYIIHYLDQFEEHPIEVFYIWQGGLELLGGVILAIAVIFFYLWYHKLPIRKYLDILAIGLMLALVFGRIGCFLNGCCFGKPTELPWAVRFPYGSFAYLSQVQPNPARNRAEPQMKLPDDFFNHYTNQNSRSKILKPYEELTLQQKQLLKENDQLRSLPVHPTELYSSANGAVLCLILYLFWKRAQKANKSQKSNKLLVKPGSTFALMFIVYGITRFCMEFLRDDNPFEYSWWAIYKGATVSQNIGIYMIIFGLILMLIFQQIKTRQPK
jgi:phosphatidylglycerol:prolipoprotein diacylglycerol transferase